MLKEIEEFPGYLASSEGHVISCKNGKNKILVERPKTNGYLYVTLSKKGKHYSLRLHRIIAKTFIPNPKQLPQVNHINENKADNRVENLMWCTASENVKWGSRRKRVSEKVSDPTIIRKNNTSGRKGVCVTKWGTYHAYMNGRGLGTYKTFDEAVKAREKAELMFLNR